MKSKEVVQLQNLLISELDRFRGDKSEVIYSFEVNYYSVKKTFRVLRNDTEFILKDMGEDEVVDIFDYDEEVIFGILDNIHKQLLCLPKDFEPEKSLDALPSWKKGEYDRKTCVEIRDYEGELIGCFIEREDSGMIRLSYVNANDEVSDLSGFLKGDGETVSIAYSDLHAIQTGLTAFMSNLTTKYELDKKNEGDSDTVEVQKPDEKSE